jgi:hypothetical protein
MSEIRTQLNEALGALQVSPLNYQYPTIDVGTIIHAVDVQEIRDKVR